MMKRPLFFAGCVYLVMTAVSFYSLNLSIVLTLLIIIRLLLCLMKGKKANNLLISSAVSILACISVLCWQERVEAQLELTGESLFMKGLITDSRTYDTAVLYDAEVPIKGQTMKLSLWSYDMEVISEGNRFEAVVILEEEEKQYWSDGSVLTAQVQEIRDLGLESSLQADCLRLRNLAQKRIESLFHGKSEEILQGLLLGEKAELSAEVEEVFLKSGSLHLLTVSGFHFSMMAAGLFLCFRILQFNPKMCSLFCFPFLLILCLVEGATVSIQRAAVMTVLALLATIFERDYDGLNSWGAALLIVLIPEPLRLFGRSFLLSFSAVLGILLFAPILQKESMRIHAWTRKETITYRLLSKIIDTVSISFSANFLTAPFLLFFFGNLPLLAPLSSLLILPLLPLIMVMAVSAMVMPFSSLASIIAAATQLLCAFMYRLLSIVADCDMVYYGENNLLLFGLIFLYVLLLLLYVFQAERRQILCSVSAYLMFLTIALGIQATFFASSLKGYVCRSSVLLCQDDRAVLIGTLEKERDLEEAERILRAEKIQSFDLLYLTENEKQKEIQILELIERWNPRYIVSASELETLELQGIEYICNPMESVHFWEDWSVSFTENGALLSNGERNFLKLHEKYAIISMYDPEYTAVLGDDWMIYGDSSVSWSKTWSGALKFSLEGKDDSGTGKPAFGTNQRG